MKLANELNFKNPIKIPAHEALLNIYYTGDLLRKRAREFFVQYNITDVQFNLMVLLRHQADEETGLTQADLSRMLLVNRSNITSLIDRMERAGLVERADVPGDRRYNAIRLTGKGRQTLRNVEDKYMDEVKKVMAALPGPEMERLVNSLEHIRQALRKA